MTVNPLPPQAYTKETLQKAYTWLLAQSPSVKDLATTQDMLVSLYLKAQRSGEASLEAPSIQNFKQELKNLASMMGDLQTVPAPQPVQQPAQQLAPPSPPQVLAPASTASAPTQTPTPVLVAQPSSNLNLDAKSLQFIQELQNQLNLSTEAEALRAIIALGYKQFKKI